MLLQSEKYSEAVPLLEKLTAKSPDDAGKLLQLGMAYLHTGDQEKASQEFHRAMELNTSLDMLNTIAWYMADAGLRLPEALGYAQRAVRETEALTSDVSSDRAKSLRAGYAMSLAADWDTLGWVYFKMGDLDAAERYVRAAWDLGLDPMMGDHLAQIYEKQGKHARATRACALALAAIPSNGDADLRDKLLAWLTAAHPADTIYMSSNKEFSRITQFPLGPVGDRRGSANFELIFSKGPVPDSVIFLAGPDEFRSFASAISALKFSVELPDDGPTVLVRHGGVYCVNAQKECRFSLYPVQNPMRQLQKARANPEDKNFAQRAGQVRDATFRYALCRRLAKLRPPRCLTLLAAASTLTTHEILDEENPPDCARDSDPGLHRSSIQRL